MTTWGNGGMGQHLRRQPPLQTLAWQTEKNNVFYCIP